MRGWCCLTAVASGLVFCGVAFAQFATPAVSGSIATPLTVDYGLTGRSEYTDNFGFSGRSTFVTSIGPTAAVRMDSEAVKLAGSVGLFATHFSNSAVGKTTTADPRFSFVGSLLQERSTYNLSSSFFRDRGFNTVAPQPTAGFQTGNQRTLFTIAPGYSYAVTERLSANAGYSYTSIFHDQPAISQPDNVSHGVSAGLQYRVTELDTAGVSLSKSQFRTTPTTTESDTTSLQVSWSRRLSDLSTATAFVGSSDTNVRGRSTQQVCLLPIQFCLSGQFPFQQITTGSDFSSRSPVYGFTYVTQWSPTLSASAQGSRSVQAGASGLVTRRDSLGAALSYRLTERTSTSLDYTWSQNAFVTSTSTAGQSATLQVLSLNVSHDLGDNWALSGGARYSMTDVTIANPNAKAVFVSISKSWPNNRLFQRP